MIDKLTKLASHLDLKGLRKEADYLDTLIRKIAQEETCLGKDIRAEVSAIITSNNMEIFDDRKTADEGEFLIVVPNPPPHSFSQYDWGIQYLTRDEANALRTRLIQAKVDEVCLGVSVQIKDTTEGTYIVKVAPPNGVWSQEEIVAQNEGYERGDAILGNEG